MAQCRNIVKVPSVSTFACVNNRFPLNFNEGILSWHSTTIRVYWTPSLSKVQKSCSSQCSSVYPFELRCPEQNAGSGIGFPKEQTINYKKQHSLLYLMVFPQRSSRETVHKCSRRGNFNFYNVQLATHHFS